MRGDWLAGDMPGSWTLRLAAERTAPPPPPSRRRGTSQPNGSRNAVGDDPISVFLHVSLPKNSLHVLLPNSTHGVAGIAGGESAPMLLAFPSTPSGGQALRAHTGPVYAFDENCTESCWQPGGSTAPPCSDIQHDPAASALCLQAHADAAKAVSSAAQRRAFAKQVKQGAQWPAPAVFNGTAPVWGACWKGSASQRWNVQPLSAALSGAKATAAAAVRKAAPGKVPPGLPPHIVPTLRGCDTAGANVAVLQLVMQAPGTAHVVFLPPQALPPNGTLDAWRAGQNATHAQVTAALDAAGVPTPDTFAPRLQAALTSFEARLSDKLQVPRLPLAVDGDVDIESKELWASIATRFALSNMLGSITRFRGQQLIADSVGGFESEQHSAAAHHMSPVQTLFTGMPSRSFFPRGFLWDEGFHQLLVMRFDPSLSKAVLQSWLSTQSTQPRGTLRDGWIAREQILGAEPRSRVPERFQVQRPDVANPPTLLLALEALLEQEGEAVDTAWLQEVYPLLVRWYNWFLRSQRTGTDLQAMDAPWTGEGGPPLSWLQEHKALTGEEAEFGQGGTPQASWDGEDSRGFVWQGSSPDHTFACGLDDSPRGLIPHHADEHVDLLAWVISAADILARVAQRVGEARHSSMFQADSAKFRSWLSRHWDADAGWFCDIGVTEVALPVRDHTSGQATTTPLQWSAAPKDSWTREFLRQQVLTQSQVDSLAPSAQVGRVCHRSYIGLMPLALGVLEPGDARVSALLQGLRQGDMLGPAGVLSLSSSSPLYRSKDDYWRGKVWMNINFLLVQALRRYASAPLPDRAGAQASDTAPPAKQGLLGRLLAFVSGQSRAPAFQGPQGWAETRRDAAEVGEQLRQRLVANVHEQFRQHGSLWENYDPETGGGTGTAPFTGWTGAVLPLLHGMASGSAEVAASGDVGG